MNDQADSLRKAIQKLSTVKAAETFAPKMNFRAKVITVTSGKGGVGKSNISVNLAIALSEIGCRPLIIDADIGLANDDVLLGINPRYRLVDVLNGEKSLGDIVCTGPCGVGLITGGSGLDELARMEGGKIGSVLSGLTELDGRFNVFIIDTGAGISETIISMAAAADEAIVVTTPEPTSVTDAYVLIKSIVYRCQGLPVRLVVNKAENEAEAADIMAKLTRVTGKFLDLELMKLGYILNDPLVVRAVKQQQPFLLGFPHSQPSRRIREIAARLAEGKTYAPPEKGRGLSGFFDGIVKLVNVQLK